MIQTIRYVNYFKAAMMLIFIFLLSCDLSVNKLNEEKEREKAEQVIHKFYTNIQNNDLPSNKDLFSSQFLKEVDFDVFNKAQLKYFKSLGDYQERTLESWTTSRSEISSEWAASLIYIVSYKNSKAFEKFELLKENDSIKIFNYIINSKALEH